MMFFKVLSVVFLAELGDKTQLLLVAMSSRYKVPHILTGVGSAILLLNLLAVMLGLAAGEFLPITAIKLIAGIAFLGFAYTFLSESKSEAARIKKGKYGPAATILGTFFLAELGDKTQLTVIALSADSGFSEALYVFLGASVGLFLADMIGLCAGLLLRFKMPDRFLGYLSFTIFTVFGIIILYEAFYIMFDSSALYTWLCSVISALLFAGLCLKKITIIFSQKKRKKKDKFKYEADAKGYKSI